MTVKESIAKLSLMPRILLELLLLSAISLQQSFAFDYPGLPTRDQTPLLQAYFIPAAPLTPRQGWAFSSSLYITNTYQRDQNALEDLTIDVENTRFDFQASLAQQDWLFNINIPLIRNSAGFLDQTIVGWHDFFGLPQGGRDQAPNNRILMRYRNTQGDVFSLSQSDSGVGDIQLAAGYRLSPRDQIWLGVEIPVSNDPLLSSQASDFALWYSHSAQTRHYLMPFAMLGLSIPAEGGLFNHRIKPLFTFGQFGLLYTWRPAFQLLAQADFHSNIVKHGELDALSNSLQAQFGLRLPRVSPDFQLDLFFSEDIYPGHAPDITFGIRFSPHHQLH